MSISVDDPSLPFVSFVEGLARATRLVMWDKRGTGLSDPVTHVPPLDERMDDLHAVMDAVGVDDAAFFGVSEGGPMSILFAATYPERVKSLALYGTMARFSPGVAGPSVGLGRRSGRSIIEEIEAHWGEGALADLFFGPIADVPGFREMYGRIQRAGASPTMCLLLWRALVESDVEWRAGRRSHADPCPRQSRRRGGAYRRCKGDGGGHAERAVPAAAAGSTRALGR